MKKLLSIFLIFLANMTFAQQEKNTNTSNIEIPADFFSGMFRVANDDFLVAWHGGVKVVSATSSVGQNNFDGSVEPFVEMLNKRYDQIFETYFYYNMKDGEKQIVSPDGKVWAARCGLKSGNNINISPVTGKEIKGFPSDITSDVWSKSFTFKRSLQDPKTHETKVIQYRIEATSIYYYHLKPSDLEGTMKRDDQYKLCGRVLFQRWGPGLSGTVVKDAKIENEKFNFSGELTMGDYQVSFMWPHGGRIILDKDFVYNPHNPSMKADFEVPVYTGEIEGKVKYKYSEKPAKNYPVKIVPACSLSGLPEKETTTDENGMYTFKDVPEGEYFVVVEGAETKNAFLTGNNSKKIKPEDAEISYKYNIYAYYNAPGFVKAGMVWRNSTILFPEEGKKPQVFDVMAYQKAGGRGEPKGTDGEKLQIPYSMTIPMIGKQTFYGYGGEGEYETPEVLYIKSLGAIPAFRLNKKHDALNSCHIVSTNGGVPHLELSIDLSAGSDGEYPEQFRIYCDNILAKANLPAFPINFKVIRFTKEDIEKFKKYEKVEKRVSNGKATLIVEFVPEKE